MVARASAGAGALPVLAREQQGPLQTPPPRAPRARGWLAEDSWACRSPVTVTLPGAQTRPFPGCEAENPSSLRGKARLGVGRRVLTRGWGQSPPLRSFGTWASLGQLREAGRGLGGVGGRAPGISTGFRKARPGPSVTTAREVQRLEPVSPQVKSHHQREPELPELADHRAQPRLLRGATLGGLFPSGPGRLKGPSPEDSGGGPRARGPGCAVGDTGRRVWLGSLGGLRVWCQSTPEAMAPSPVPTPVAWGTEQCLHS